MIRSFLPLLLVAPACINLPEAPADTDGPDAETGTPEETESGLETGTETDGGPCTLIMQDDLVDDLSLPAGCYEVELPLFIDGVTLAMAPGVDVTFAAAGGLTVSGTGVLSAVGTADDPVVLHGQSDQRESWLGLSFANAASSANVLEQTVVSAASGVTVSDGSRLQVRGCELLNHAGYAFDAADGSEIMLEATTLDGNEAPLRVGVSTVQGVAADNVFVGNDQDFALIVGATVAADATWHAIGIPFHIESRLHVEAALTVDPGVTIGVAQDVDLRVEPTGSLNAVGTADAPITLRGIQAERGYWMGIRMASNATANVFEHVIVENGGSGEWYGGGDASAAIYLPEEGKLVLRNSTVRGSERYGLLASGESDLSGFEGNTFADSGRTFLIAADLGGDIDAATRFENNDEQVARIGTGSSDRVSVDQTWASLAIPWRLPHRMFVSAAWTVAAGAVIEVSQDNAIYIEPEGSLHAAGTEDEPILFTGADTVPGFWGGIEFESTASANALQHTVVEYAGSSAWQGGLDKEAALYVPEDGIVSLSDTTLRESAGHGVLLSGGAIDCSGVSFEAIAGDNVSGDGSSNC